MARISTYNIDQNVTAQDKFIGTDSSGGVTKNFTFEGITNFLNNTSAIAIAGQNNFFFQTDLSHGRNPGTISFSSGGGVNTAFNSLTTIRFSRFASSGNNVLDYLQTLVDKNVILAQVDDVNNFGVYKLLSLDPAEFEPDFYDATFEIQENHGALLFDKFYAFAVYSGAATAPQDLQSVTDIGNTTDNNIIVENIAYTSTIMPGDIVTQELSTNKYSFLSADGIIGMGNGSQESKFKNTNVTNPNVVLEFPNKAAGSYTIATTADVPTTPSLQDVTTVGNTTITEIISESGLIVNSADIPDSAAYLAKLGIFSILQSGTLRYGGSFELRETSSDGSGNVALVLPSALTEDRVLYLPNKNGTLAVTTDLPTQYLTSANIDANIGDRLKPLDVNSNGFYFNRGFNGSVGYTAINTNTGNAAVVSHGVGIDTNSYIKNIFTAKFGPNYFVPLLAGKGGLLGTEEVFVGSTDGNDVSVLTGPAFASITRKFTVKANGQLLIQTEPTAGATSDSILLRDSSGNVKQIAYPTIDSIPTDGSSNAVSSDGVFDALALKADLVGGKVPASQLPSYVDDVVEVANFAALPVTGEIGKIYVTLDTGFIYRWTGTVYVQIATGGSVTSVGLTMPSAFSVSNSPITTTGDIAVTGAGVASQYVRGDGTLANFPTSTGGGASVSYYLNGSVSQGTIGGAAYKGINGTPVIGTGTDFTINADGYITQFITDAGDPNKLSIPGGNWNFETYFSASSGGGTPQFYIELYKYDGATFTLIASNSATPENITGGTSIDLYFTALAVPPTVLLLTDRLAVRFYVLHSGRTITMHTENSHLSQIITTFSTGLTGLNGLTSQVQYLATGTAGTDFGISSSGDTHTFNLPTASATSRGALSLENWSTFNSKQDALVSGTNIKTINGNNVLGSGDLVLGVALTREEFTFTSSQSFTLAGTPSYIYAVFVNGQELNSSQYSFVGTTLTIIGTLEIVNGLPDKVNILYTPTTAGVLEYYTKAQVDTFLTNKVPTTRTISTTAPLTGGGDLSANRTLSMPPANSGQDGYLYGTDFLYFQNKQEPITLTTSGYGGLATFEGTVLNIPSIDPWIPAMVGNETFRGVNFSNNSTTDTVSGGVTVSTSASVAARSVASTNFAAKQIRKGFYASVVSAGRYTGMRGSALLWYMGGGFKYVCDFYISDTAYGSGCRQFYGMAGQTTDLTYSDSVLVSSLTNIIGVGSDAGDAWLQVYYNDATGAATKVDLGSNFPANRTAGAALTTVYSVELYNRPGTTEVKYIVTNKELGASSFGIITTNLPLHTQGLNFFASRCMGAGVTNTGQFDLLTLGVYSL